MNIFAKQRKALVCYHFGGTSYGDLTYAFYGALNSEKLEEIRKVIANSEGVKDSVTPKCPVVFKSITILES